MKILVVDDELVILNGICCIIETECKFPYEIMKASSGIEAFHMAQTFQPDVMLVDINMPEMDGFEMINALNDSGFHSRYIIITGYSEYQYAVQAIRIHAVDYLLKPVNADTLCKLLTESYRYVMKSQALNMKRMLQDIRSNMIYQEPLEILETNIEELKAFLEYDYLMSVIIGYNEDMPFDMDHVLQKIYKQNMQEADVRFKSILINKGTKIVYLLNCSNYITQQLMLDTINNTQGQCSERLAFHAGISVMKRTRETIYSLPLLYENSLKNYWIHLLLTPEQESFSAQHDQSVDVIDYSFCTACLKERQTDRISEELKKMAEYIKSTDSGFMLGYINLCASIQVYGYQMSLGLPNKVISLINNCAHFSPDAFTMDQFIELGNQLLKAMREFEHKPGKQYSIHMKNALTYINSSFCEICSIDQVADAIHLHPNYVSSLFKKETGMSFTRYINNLRVERAKDLLCGHEMSVEEVAETTGFNTMRYFYKVFKESTGISPGKYHSRF